MAKQKVAVSERALHQRINRKLDGDEEVLRKSRQQGYLHIDYRLNALIESDVDLEQFARKLGVIQPWEQLKAE